MEIKLSLKAARVNAGYDLNDVCKKLGKSQSLMSQVEQGKRKLLPSELNQLLTMYGVKRDNIFLPESYEKIVKN